MRRIDRVFLPISIVSGVPDSPTTKTMNKVISTDGRICMCVAGPSESGKTRLIFDMLTSGTFYKPFDKVYYFYRHQQPIYEDFRKSVINIDFIQINNSEDFDIINSIVENIKGFGPEGLEGGEKYKTLMIYDDIAEELLKNADFSNLVTAGRHKNISIIFIKHNVFQQGKHSVTIDKNTTQLVIMKSPRLGRQLKIIGFELGNTKFLDDCYRKAVLETGEPYGHLLIDLSQHCPESLRYSSNVTSRPSSFWIPTKNARSSIASNADTDALYSGVRKRSHDRAFGENVF
jgi:hypothetical protein